MEIVDADGRRYRRRLAPKAAVEDGDTSIRTRTDMGTADVRRGGVGEIHDDETEELRRMGRECPVPKPAGAVGRLLGFRREEQRLVPGVHILGENDVRIASGKNEKEAG